MAVREYLGIDPDDPEGFSNQAYTFEDLRHLVEDAGIWVFKRSFRQKDIAGLCLGDDAYPVIYVGNGQSAATQIFTLFNGLAHLLFDFNYLERTDRYFYLACLSATAKLSNVLVFSSPLNFSTTLNGRAGYPLTDIPRQPYPPETKIFTTLLRPQTWDRSTCARRSWPLKSAKLRSQIFPYFWELKAGTSTGWNAMSGNENPWQWCTFWTTTPSAKYGIPITGIFSQLLGAI